MNNDKESLFDKWYEFREEELNIMQNDEVDYSGFDKHYETLKNYFKEENIENGCKELEKLYQDLMEYMERWNKKYYESGWNDSIEMFYGVVQKKRGDV